MNSHHKVKIFLSFPSAFHAEHSAPPFVFSFILFLLSTMSFFAYSCNRQDNMMCLKNVISGMAPIPIIKTSAAETQERMTLQRSVNVGTNANPIMEKCYYDISVYDNQDVECL